MSYIPPHKRHTKGSPLPEPTPAPESLIPAFRKNLNFKRKDKFLFEIRYAHCAVRKWFPVGLTDDSHFSSLVKLQPLSIDRKSSSFGPNARYYYFFVLFLQNLNLHVLFCLLIMYLISASDFLEIGKSGFQTM